MKKYNFKIAAIGGVFFMSIGAVKAQSKDFTPTPVPMPEPSIHLVLPDSLASKLLKPRSMSPDLYDAPPDIYDLPPNVYVVPPNGYTVPPNGHFLRPGIYDMAPDRMPCVVPALRNVARMPVQKNRRWLPQPK